MVGYAGYGTPEEVARRQRMAQALMTAGATSRPRTLGGGIASLGASLGGMMAARAANRQEEAGRALATQAYSPVAAALSSEPQEGRSAAKNMPQETLFSLAGNPWLTGGQKAVVSALLQQQMQADPVDERRALAEEYGLSGDRAARYVMTGSLPEPRAPRAPSPYDVRAGVANRFDLSPEARQSFILTGELPGGYKPQSPEGKLWADYQNEAIPEEVYSAKTQAIGTPGVVVENNMGGEMETAYDKDRGKTFAAQMGEIENVARAARKAKTSLNVMRQAMNDDEFYSGAGGETILEVRKAAASLGFADPEGIDSAEAFNAQSKAAALEAMGGSLGTGFSNADRDFVIDQVPNLSVSKEGNALLVDIQDRMQDRKLEIARRARQYENVHGRIDGGFFSELDEWSEANPVFDSGFMARARGTAGGEAPAAIPDNVPDEVREVWEYLSEEDKALWN